MNSNDTADERQRALLGIARSALNDYGIEGATLTTIGDGSNSSFRASSEYGQWHLKIYDQSRHAPSHVESEMLFAEALVASGFPTPEPLRCSEGGVTWQAPAAVAGVQCSVVVMSWCNGKYVPNDKRTLEHFGTAGTVLALLHQHSQSWSVPEGFARPRCDSEGFYGAQGLWGDRIHKAMSSLPTELRDDLVRTRDALKTCEAELGHGSGVYGLVHADAKFDNFLFDGDTPYLIDFGDCGWGYYAYDLAVQLAGAWAKPGYEQSRAALFEGYQEVRQLSSAEKSAIPSMMASRAARCIVDEEIETPARHRNREKGQWRRLNDYMHQADGF